MYKFTLKHRDSSSQNLINPYEMHQGYLPDADTQLSGYDHTSLIDVTPGGYSYFEQDGNYNYSNRRVTFYDSYGQIVQDAVGFDQVLTIPVGVTAIRLAIQSNENGLDAEKACLVAGFGGGYSPYFTSRDVNPIYSSQKLEYGKESNYEFYRRKLKGQLTLLKDDYDYINGLDLDTEFFLEVINDSIDFDKYIGYFFKTDCKFNADDRIVKFSTSTLDDYGKVLAGLQKTYNLVDLVPSTESVTLTRRPMIQFYTLGDRVVTNVLGSSSWEQEIQIDPVFNGNDMSDYKFTLSYAAKLIPLSAASGLSTDVTGDYDFSNVNTNGLYELMVSGGSSLFTYIFYIRRVSDNVILYQTDETDYYYSGLHLIPFNGVNGETGSFYFVRYEVYTRFLVYEGFANPNDSYIEESFPDSDIVANSSNYTRVYNDSTVSYGSFEISEDSLSVPTSLGRIPDDAPNGGRYYKELPTDFSQSPILKPVPIERSGWKAVSLWFKPNFLFDADLGFRGTDVPLKDAYPLHSVIQNLLSAIGSDVSFLPDTEHSEFLFAQTNPLGQFEYSGSYNSFNADTIGNLDYFITPKSNLININYDQAAKKGDITLKMVLDMLKFAFKVHWHIDNKKLRLEHISWYQKGGTYGSEPLIGSDLTVLQNVKNNKSWDFAQNKFEYDKEAMPERFEFDWMDGVSSNFEGFDIEILSNFTQEGKIENYNLSPFTTDVDFIIGSPESISKDGFVLLGAVKESEGFRLPIVRSFEYGSGTTSLLQNGFLSFPYLHSKYHTSDLPSNRVKINGNDVTLLTNVTKQKKQKVKYPLVNTINPYKLVKTGLGNGRIEKLTVNLESNVVDGTLKHDTDGNT